MNTIRLQENERMLAIIHRHWFVIARELVVIAGMLLVGAFIYFLKGSLYSFANAAVINPLVSFLLSLYMLFVFALMFALWINYRLDVWIITTRRVIDIEQRGLFNREVSEFLISRVQDVTSEVPDITATLLGFGNITIQTAGHKNFYVREIPNTKEAKRLLLTYSHKARLEEFAVHTGT